MKMLLRPNCENVLAIVKSILLTICPTVFKRRSPCLLGTALSLTPVHLVVALVDAAKATACRDAMQDALQGQQVRKNQVHNLVINMSIARFSKTEALPR